MRKLCLALVLALALTACTPAPASGGEKVSLTALT